MHLKMLGARVYVMNEIERMWKVDGGGRVPSNVRVANVSLVLKKI